MSRPRALAPGLWAGVVALSIALWMGTGELALAAAPMLLTVLLWGLLKAPPHRTALAVFFLAIVTDNPKEHPAEDRWTSPLKPLGTLLYENLNTLTGISALRFCMVDLLLAALFLIAVVREQQPGAMRPPRALHGVLAAAWLAVVWLEVWGLSRGGDFKASLWQARPLFWAPVIAYVFAAGVRGPRDHAALGKAVLIAAVVKASFGLYYYQVVCRPLGYVPAYATTHSDTVLFVTAAVIAIAAVIEIRTLRIALIALAILLAAGIGIVVNGRRLAYIALVGSIVAIRFVLPPDRLRRAFDRTLLAAVPLAATYLAIGWRSTSTLFGPARKVASLFSSEDRSSAMRDIENYNLVLTWKRQMLLGSGFGHPYSEMTRPDGIDRIFPLYRYIGHNSVLWLQTAGGIAGFTAFWMLLATLGYFAARSRRLAVQPLDRAAALVTLAVVAIFGVQAHGDMGLNSWTSMFVLGMSLAVASKLALAVGAFPATRGALVRAAPAPSLHPLTGR